MAKVPFYSVNAVAFVWILKSLTKTIKILKKTKQTFKTKLYNNFYFAVIITFVILIFGGVLQLLLLVIRGLDTTFMRLVSNELLPTLFSIAIFSIMLTMRPTTKSKLLVHHEELQEEHTEHSVDNGYGVQRASVIRELSGVGKYYEDNTQDMKVMKKVEERDMEFGEPPRGIESNDEEDNDLSEGEEEESEDEDVDEGENNYHENAGEEDNEDIKEEHEDRKEDHKDEEEEHKDKKEKHRDEEEHKDKEEGHKDKEEEHRDEEEDIKDEGGDHKDEKDHKGDVEEENEDTTNDNAKHEGEDLQEKNSEGDIEEIDGGEAIPEGEN